MVGVGGGLGVRRGPLGLARRGVAGEVPRDASAETGADALGFLGATIGAAVARGGVFARS